MSFPTKEQIEDYIVEIEEYISTSFQSVTPDIPAIQEMIYRLWADVSRFGPPEMPRFPDLNDLQIPGLGNFEVPPPPPPPPLPPPPELTWPEEVVEWVARHRWAVSIAGVGLGVAAAYGTAEYVRRVKARARRAQSPSGRKVVVVLGGDSPLGPPLIAALEKEGYIVIASVSHPDAVTPLEAASNGFVRALVLDPYEPSTTPVFLRSLQATLSLRFPLNTSGDHYHASPSTLPQLHSIISLLSLSTSDRTPLPAPLEHLNLTDSYTPFLQATHITPLRALQGLLPLFRVSPARAADQSRYLHSLRHGFERLLGLGWARSTRSIVICVPATDARVGVPFAGAQAMSAAATVRGAEVLRREIAAAAFNHGGDHYADSMRNLKVVVVDVGAVGEASHIAADEDEEDEAEELEKSMAAWTPVERVVYGSAFLGFVRTSKRRWAGHCSKSRRRATAVRYFVDALVTTVGKTGQAQTRTAATRSPFSVGLRLWCSNLKRGARGERFSVGAGAATYAFASKLPTPLLDILLNLPALLTSIRNRFLPLPSPPPLTSPYPPPGPAAATDNPSSFAEQVVAPAEKHEHEAEEAQQGARQDLDPSGAATATPAAEGDLIDFQSSTMVDSSWISVQDQ